MRTAKCLVMPFNYREVHHNRSRPRGNNEQRMRTGSLSLRCHRAPSPDRCELQHRIGLRPEFKRNSFRQLRVPRGDRKNPTSLATHCSGNRSLLGGITQEPRRDSAFHPGFLRAFKLGGAFCRDRVNPVMGSERRLSAIRHLQRNME